MANKLTYQTGEPDIFVAGGPRKNLPLLRGWECEDFAPRNGATRASGERGAKKRGRRAPGRRKVAAVKESADHLKKHLRGDALLIDFVFICGLI